jgi:hypothetical protein
MGHGQQTHCLMRGSGMLNDWAWLNRNGRVHYPPYNGQQPEQVSGSRRR